MRVLRKIVAYPLMWGGALLAVVAPLYGFLGSLAWGFAAARTKRIYPVCWEEQLGMWGFFLVCMFIGVIGYWCLCLAERTLGRR